MSKGVADPIFRLLSMPGHIMRGLAAFAARLNGKRTRLKPPRATSHRRNSLVRRRDPRDVGVPPHARRQRTSS